MSDVFSRCAGSVLFSLLCASACARPVGPAPNQSSAGVAPAAVAKPTATAQPAAVATASGGAPSPVVAARKYEKPSDEVLRQKLSPLAYDVTQHAATEMPFANQYWNNHEDGIYVDAVTGEPLFSSRDKFDSGTGWPSFTRPIDDKSVVDHTDQTLGMTRTEVRSKTGNSHLGHVFDDGPAPTGQRYCINSAALRFIPAADLSKEGYGEYASQFAR